MKEKLERLLDSLDKYELQRIWEAFCEEYAPEESIYEMKSSDLDDKLKNYSPSEIINMIDVKDFNPKHKYWAFDNYQGKDILVSSDNYKSLVLTDMLAKHIIDNNEDFNNEKIKAVLKGNK